MLPGRLSRNVGSNYLLAAVGMVVALVTTPLLVGELGKVEYGIWAVVGSLMWWVPVLEFGFGGATVKYVAEHKSRQDPEQLRRTVATSFWLLALAALGACLLGGALALLFPVLFDIPAEVERAAQLLVLVIALDAAASMPMDTFGNALVALQRYDLLNATLIAVMVAQALGWWIVLAAGGGLVALGVVTVAISLVGQVTRAVVARRLSSDVTISPRYFDRAAIRPLASLSFWLWLTTASKLVIRRLDTVVVGLVVGVPEAAVYAVAQKLAFLGDQGVSPLVRVFFPFSAEQAARRDLRELRSTLVVGTRLTLFVAGPICLALGLLAEPAIRAWIGPGFDDGALVVVFLAATTAVKALTQIGLQVLPAAGEARVPALIMAGEAVLNLSLSVALGTTMGLEGVALATLIAATAAHLGLLLPYTVGRVDLPLGAFLAGVARAHALPVGAAALVGIALRRVELDGIPAVVGAGLAVAGTYALVFAATGLDADERHRLAAPLRSLFGRAA